MFFNKNSQKDSLHEATSGVVTCPCTSQQGLFITNRHATWAVALAILWSFFMFISGYFLGQRTVLEQFAHRLEQDSLSDKIYSSLCTLYEVDNEAEVTDNDTDLDSETDETSTEGEQGQKIPVNDHVVAHATAPLLVHTEIKKEKEQKEKRYYAPLAGFSSAERAYAFAQRCNNKNIKVVVKKKPSTSAKGRVHYWYQVITQSYDDKQTLITALDTIKRTEHIRDIHILEA